MNFKVFTYYKGLDLIVVATEVDATPGCPAKINGPPENCYPAEDPEVEVTDGYLVVDGDHFLGTLYLEDGTVIKSNVMFEAVLEGGYDMTDKLYEAAGEYAASEREAAMEAKADAMREDRLMGEW